MGLTKRHWETQQEALEDEKKAEWIRNYLQDDEANELSDEWSDAEEAYSEALYLRYREWEDKEDYQDYWTVEGKTSFQIFNEIIVSSNEIINFNITNLQVRKNLFVMLYGHVIAAVEGYLSSTFINNVMSTEDCLRKLVESDPEFGKRTFTIKEIFTRKEQLENDVRKHLRELIFHDISKIKRMYNSVLNIDFGNDLKWLFSAVSLRHDCVHRAGYDKDGNEVDLSKAVIEDLIKNCINLVALIENKLLIVKI